METKKVDIADDITMSSVRENPKLRFLFQANRLNGLDIPQKLTSSRQSRVSKWEIALFLASLASWAAIMYLLLTSLRSFKVSSMCQPMVTFITYFIALTKGAYLLWRKDDLITLLRKIDEILGIPAFQTQHKSVLEFTWKRVRKTFLILIVTWACCYVTVTITFSRFDRSIRMRKEQDINFTLTEEEKITSEILRSAEWTKSDYIILCVNAFFGTSLPCKNICIDTLMFLFHYFVAEELKFLQQNFHVGAKFNQKKIAFVIEQDAFISNEWMLLYNKIKWLHNGVNDLFGVPILISVGSSLTFLCFVTYSAAKFPTFTVILAMIQLGLLFLVLIFTACQSGQNLKDAAQLLNNTICDGPWPDASLVPGYNLIVIDAQSVFLVKGGAFFTLSLEYFASLMGAVLTYFIILVQIKD